MTARRCDIAILGGGLAGGLAALALARSRPDLDILLVEQEETLGGNHVWSFFGTDVGKAGRDLIAPLVEKAWPGYAVFFPGHARELPTSYYSVTSDRFDAHLKNTLSSDSIVTGVRALSCTPTSAALSDGTRIEAHGVLDARGIRNYTGLTGGWQKFLGKRLKLAAPHRIARPVVMDATVDQIDGYRFVYVLPFGPDEVFVEDTYYSDGPALDAAQLSARVDAYAEAQGWQVAAVLGQEQGLLPVVAGGDFNAFWRAGGAGVAHAGSRAALFHAVTSYSLPDAVRFALMLARQADLSGAAIAMKSEQYASRHWKRMSFYRTLCTMLFAAAEPGERYRIFERFYRLRPGLIERFYAGRSTLPDKARILAGKPPVPVGRAISALAGLGNSPQPLTLAGMRKP